MATTPLSGFQNPKKRSECTCPCHAVGGIHFVACCVPDEYFKAEEIKSLKLLKYSIPGWAFDVASELEAARLLWPHICNLCREGDEFFPAPDPNDVHSMLNTPCGCEFGLETDDEDEEF